MRIGRLRRGDGVLPAERHQGQQRGAGVRGSALAAMALTALSLSACSGSTNGHGTASTGAPTGTAGAVSSAPTTRPASPPTVSSAQLASTLLRGTDLPSTWKGEKGDTPAHPDALNNQLAACLHVPAPGGGSAAQFSTSFYDPATQAGAYSTARPRTSALHNLYRAILTSPLRNFCMTKAEQSAAAPLPPNTKLGTVASYVRGAISGQPSNTVFVELTTIEFIGQPATFTEFIERAIVEGPSVDASVVVTSDNSAPNLLIQRKALSAVAARVRSI